MSANGWHEHAIRTDVKAMYHSDNATKLNGARRQREHSSHAHVVGAAIALRSFVDREGDKVAQQTLPADARTDHDRCLQTSADRESQMRIDARQLFATW